MSRLQIPSISSMNASLSLSVSECFTAAVITVLLIRCTGDEGTRTPGGGAAMLTGFGAVLMEELFMVAASASKSARKESIPLLWPQSSFLATEEEDDEE